MAKIGLRYPIFAQVEDDNNGGVPIYKEGKVIGRAMSADVAWSRSNNKLYADDGVAESDNSITGGTVTIGVDDLKDEVMAYLLGGRIVTEDGHTEYIDNGDGGPVGGLGYIRVRKLRGKVEYIAYWIYRVSFALGDESASTKGENIEWQTATIQGDMEGIQGESAMPEYRVHATFATAEAAKAWLKAKAGITDPNALEDKT